MDDALGDLLECGGVGVEGLDVLLWGVLVVRGGLCGSGLVGMVGLVGMAGLVRWGWQGWFDKDG